MLISDVHFLKAFSPIETTLCGRMIFLRYLQFSNIPGPTTFIPSGNVNSDIRVPAKLSLPISVTELGIFISARLVQPLKNPSGIEVMFCGRRISLSLTHPSSIPVLSLVMPSDKNSLSSEVQFLKRF